MNALKKLKICGYKTIKELEFEPRNLNVLIGANGSGKSNMISLFRLLDWQFGPPSGNLQMFIGLKGGASANLHDGPKVSPHMEIEICLETNNGLNDYYCRLFHAAGDTLIFADEKYRYSAHHHHTNTKARWCELGAGHRETKMVERQENTAQIFLNLLRRIKVYQFHDTSFNSRIRGKWNASDNRHLKEDGSNLAAFLNRIKLHDAKHYRVIVDTIRSIIPFFNDFVLEEDSGSILMRWSENGTDMVFDASQASDGMLRAIALVALLGQPSDNLPDVLIIDEPELGLHPHAISIITGMLKNVARNVQVIVSTQSVPFIDEFEPEDIVVVERCGRETVCKRLDSKELDAWLDQYSLSELWEKNVIGGKP